MKNYFSILLLCLLSCHTSQTSDDIKTVTVDLSGQGKEIPISRFVSSCQFIPLETKDECLLGEIDKIEQKDGELYVLDRSHNAIFVFGMDGKHHRTLSQVGNGPGEYFQLMDFDIADGLLYALDFATQRVLTYDLQFQYKNQFKYKAYSTQLAVNGEYVYLYNLKSRKGPDHKFSKYTLSGEKRDDYIERPDHENLQNYNECNVFARLGSTLYLSPVYGNMIYESEQMKPVVQIDFKDKAFPNDRNIEEELIFDPGFPYLVKNNWFLSDRFILIDFFSDQTRTACLWDQSTHSVEAGVLQNDMVPDYRFFPRWGDGECLLEEIPASLLIESFPEVQHHFPVLQLITDDDNPVVVRYEWKK